MEVHLPQHHRPFWTDASKATEGIGSVEEEMVANKLKMVAEGSSWWEDPFFTC